MIPLYTQATKVQADGDDADSNCTQISFDEALGGAPTIAEIECTYPTCTKILRGRNNLNRHLKVRIVALNTLRVQVLGVGDTSHLAE